MPLKIGNDLILFDVVEIADLFKVTPLTVKNYIRSGKLKGRKMGRKWYASETSLGEFFNTSRREEAKSKRVKKKKEGR